MEVKKYRGGAPKKAEEEARTRLVRVLFSTPEFSRLLERMKTTESTDLSKFIRTICLDKPMRMKPQLSTHQENVLSLLLEIRTDILRIGVNVNQAARRINNMTDYQKLQHEVNEMAQQVYRFEGQLTELMTAFEIADLPNPQANGCTN